MDPLYPGGVEHPEVGPDQVAVVGVRPALVQAHRVEPDGELLVADTVVMVDAVDPGRGVARVPGVRRVARVQVHRRGLAPPRGAQHNGTGVGAEVRHAGVNFI